MTITNAKRGNKSNVCDAKRGNKELLVEQIQLGWIEEEERTHRNLQLLHLLKGVQGFVRQVAPHAGLQQRVEGHPVSLQPCCHQHIKPAKTSRFPYRLVRVMYFRYDIIPVQAYVLCNAKLQCIPC